MKKNLVTIALAFTMVLIMVAFSGCGNKDEEASDLEYIIDKGKLVVGITDFAPMDFKDDAGKWVGFDAEMAEAFGKSIGVEVEFIEIDWDSKEMELENKSIDCV